MVRPTAAGLTVPLSRAKDTTPLASVLHVLGSRSRLETLQILMDGPRLTAELPARHDELNMLQDVGVVTSVAVVGGAGSVGTGRPVPERLTRKENGTICVQSAPRSGLPRLRLLTNGPFSQSVEWVSVQWRRTDGICSQYAARQGSAVRRKARRAQHSLEQAHRRTRRGS